MSGCKTNKKLHQPSYFPSLRKWKHEEVRREVEAPALKMTIAAMNQANVKKGLICSWQNQEGEFISNPDAANIVNQHPTVL